MKRSTRELSPKELIEINNKIWDFAMELERKIKTGECINPAPIERDFIRNLAKEYNITHENSISRLHRWFARATNDIRRNRLIK